MRLPSSISVPDLGANHEGAGAGEFPCAATLSREAYRAVVDLDLGISGSKARQLVRSFIRDTNEGRTTADFRTWYADPTCQTAIRNLEGS